MVRCLHFLLANEIRSYCICGDWCLSMDPLILIYFHPCHLIHFTCSLRLVHWPMSPQPPTARFDINQINNGCDVHDKTSIFVENLFLNNIAGVIQFQRYLLSLTKIPTYTFIPNPSTRLHRDRNAPSKLLWNNNNFVPVSRSMKSVTKQ